MVEDRSWGRRLFLIGNTAFLAALALMCILPLVHVLAVSFSSNTAASAGLVKLWPIDFNTKSYEYVLRQEAFLRSLFVSVERVVLGTIVNMVLIVLTAYPLSKEVQAFRMRTIYVWTFFLTILFGGGLVPTYMVVQKTGIMNTIWALILPHAVPVFSVVLLLNFFRGLPKELEEAALIDGAGPFTIMWRVFVPLSTPALATLALFSMVGHWNAWFDGLIYMHTPEKYPLQSYLQTVIIQQDLQQLSMTDDKLLKLISDRTFSAAQIFLGALPILLVYPFLQKYFMKGIVLGSVKG
ncbi:carbohydrate ABC transporter permease [Paenibacillus mesophilus]|uniref:carbohydrate ABC transporter permease n=1 Tax=Paenibacillus mesophilus TaxID=2582849 RepID=UPI00110E7820|nr:carbohydrate ABC transporter permease [Paenibacillus mesophilus]TMV51875.1 carbohydrate ABC transporter permease [Paenibacillus mesophilus]